MFGKGHMIRNMRTGAQVHVGHADIRDCLFAAAEPLCGVYLRTGEYTRAENERRARRTSAARGSRRASRPTARTCTSATGRPTRARGSDMEGTVVVLDGFVFVRHDMAWSSEPKVTRTFFPLDARPDHVTEGATARYSRDYKEWRVSDGPGGRERAFRPYDGPRVEARHETFAVDPPKVRKGVETRFQPHRGWQKRTAKGRVDA